MNDIGKAVIMAGQVLMFVFAATIAIFLYNKLTNSVEEVMLANNYSNRGDAIVDVEENTTRTATKEEIIMAILDLKDKFEKTGDESYAVVVNGRNYTYSSGDDSISIGGYKESFDTFALRSILISDTYIPSGDYELTYNSTGKTLIYNPK